MKVKTYVDIRSQEVQVEITAEHIVEALRENVEEARRDHAIKMLFNEVSRLLRRMGPEDIDKLSAPAKKLIHEFCLEQAERFA